MYGVAKGSDIDTEDKGSEVIPDVQSTDRKFCGRDIKTYEPDGCYVIGGSVNDKLLTLDRVKKTKRGYTETSQDHIVNSSADDEAAYGFAYAESDKKQTETILKTGETIEEGTTPQILYAKQVKQKAKRLQKYRFRPKNRQKNFTMSMRKVISTACTPRSVRRYREQMINLALW